MPVSRKLIITADDYGMCDAVNEAVEECMRVGTLRATCVMTNMPACTRAAFLRKKFPGNSIGIHWTLTEGKPVLPPSLVSSLVRPDGGFYSSSELRSRLLRQRTNLNEVKEELRAQYRRFRQLAGEPDFWNTHQDAHVWPRLFETCVALGVELRIPAMRCHRRFTAARHWDSTHYNLRHPLFWLKGKVILHWAKQAQARGVLMPDGKISMFSYDVDIDSFLEVARRLPWNSVRNAVELVIHPVANKEVPFTLNVERRILEYNVFMNPDLLKLMGDIGVEPATFGVLHNGC